MAPADAVRVDLATAWMELQSALSHALGGHAPAEQDDGPSTSKPSVRSQPSPSRKLARISQPPASAQAEAKPRPIVPFSPEYYVACSIGGMLSCGLTHLLVTPLDVVKCNIQNNPVKYDGIWQGFKLVVAEQGVQGLFRGWVPTLLGYSAQGICKFGFYEYFKRCVACCRAQEHRLSA